MCSIACTPFPIHDRTYVASTAAAAATASIAKLGHYYLWAHKRYCCCSFLSDRWSLMQRSELRRLLLPASTGLANMMPSPELFGSQQLAPSA